MLRVVGLHRARYARASPPVCVAALAVLIALLLVACGSNVVNGRTHKRVREHNLPKLETPEQRAAKYDRALRKALELRGRRRR